MLAEGQKVSEELGEVWWEALEDLPIEAIEHAARIFQRTSTYKPKPAHLRQILDADRSAWPEAHEAWNLAPKDEAQAGWMCEEIAVALSASQDAIDRGDLYAARRSFVEVYEREVKRAELAGRAPRWWISEASSGGYEQRLHQRQALLQNQPQRRSDLIAPTQRALAALGSGTRLSDESGGGLRQLVAPKATAN
jgi:hypothetical protein